MFSNGPRSDLALSGRRRARRVLDLLESWAKVGVVASALSADRQAELIDRLRRATLHRTTEGATPASDAVADAVAAFAAGRDMAILVAWNVDEEPALLLSFKALNRSVPHLRRVHPDGFVVLNQPLTAALLVDFDADDPGVVHIDRLTLQPVDRQMPPPQ